MPPSESGEKWKKRLIFLHFSNKRLVKFVSFQLKLTLKMASAGIIPLFFLHQRADKTFEVFVFVIHIFHTPSFWHFIKFYHLVSYRDSVLSGPDDFPITSPAKILSFDLQFL